MIAGFASPPVSSHPGLLHHVSASFSNMNTFSSPLARTSHVHYCIWFWLPRSVCSLSNILCPVLYWRLLYILANCTFRLLHKSRYPSYHNPIVILKIARHLFLQSCSISYARHRLLDLILSVSNVGFPISPLPPGKGWISRSYTQHTCPYCSFQPTRPAHHPIFL